MGQRRPASRRRTVATRALVAGAVALLAGVLGSVAVALASSPSPTPSGGHNTVLRVGWINEPDNLNPFIGYSTSDYVVWHLNYDLLVGYDARTVRPRGELAESWSNSPDGKVWTFKLRRGVTWQDGVPFTARDVAFTYNYVVDNNMSAFTNYTAFIKHTEAVDDYTVRIVCTKPKANILGMWIPILPEHIWSKVSPAAAARSFTNPTPIVGTGPFQTVVWKPRQFVEMRANPHYWRGRPRIDEVVFAVYQNPDTIVDDLRAGTIDAAWGVPTAAFDRLHGGSSLKSIAYVVKGFDHLAFNCYTGQSSGNPVLRDPAFRRALEWAVDKDKIVRLAYDSHAYPASTIIMAHFYKDPDWHWEPPADQAYRFDLKKAGELLTQAGYPLKNGARLDKHGKPITLRLFACDAPPQAQMSAKLITGWFRQLGLHIMYIYMSEPAMSARVFNMSGSVFKPDYDMILWNWTGDVDPAFILSVFLTNQINSWSDCAYSNPVYDRLYDQQLTTLDGKQRKAVMDTMQQVLYKDSPYIVLVYPQALEAVNTARWTGWVQSPSNGSAVYSVDNIDSYLFVHPKGAAAKGGGSAALAAALAAAAALVVAIVVWLVMRGRGRAVEER
jgi:peptide/nickel transport system substrate-binding protein